MESFLRSKQFDEYQKLMLKEIAEFFSNKLFGDTSDLEQLRGAVELGRILIRLPLKIKRDKFVGEIIYKNLESLKADFVRMVLERSIVEVPGSQEKNET